MRAPKLKPIALRKIKVSIGPHHDHPDIRCDRYYLAKIGGRFYAGKFTRQWYGLNFDAVYDAGYQLDSEGWQALWEIVPQK